MPFNISCFTHPSLPGCRVIYSTIDFIWSNQVGQVANRFSRDMNEVDLILPGTIKNFIYQVGEGTVRGISAGSFSKIKSHSLRTPGHDAVNDENKIFKTEGGKEKSM